MKKTPLADIHLKYGARMAGFAGWEMPIQYDGIVAEHKAVREAVGVFDISHMGIFIASGEGVGDWLNGILTNDTSKLSDSEGQYTLMLNENGGVIDDMIIYRETVNKFFLVVNASMIEDDFEWMNSRMENHVGLSDKSKAYGGLAIQGPNAVELWDKLNTGCSLPPKNGILRHKNFIVCRTGYTGEDGFEFFAPSDEISGWFQQMADFGAKPCGLGARDTLRLEKCYPLNGNDLNPENTPLEAGLAFFTKLKTSIDFVGRKALDKQKSDGLSERLTAIKMTGKAPPPRHGYKVIDPDGGKVIGELSSGSMSPCLGVGIAMAYLPAEMAKAGKSVEIEIRKKKFPAVVVKKPFL